MRPVLFIALLGTILSTSPVAAQSSADQRTSGTVHKRRTGSSAIDALFENGPGRPNALEEARREAAQRKTQAQKASESAVAMPALPAPVATPVLPIVQAAAPGPPQKDLTGDEFGLIRVGSSAEDVVAMLGPPSSRVVVPDDDGHLRESFQYWVKGSRMGTVRVDNGRVVQIETNR